MELKKWMQVVLVCSSILTLAACSSHKKPDQGAIDAANAAYGNGGAQTSGYGRESEFGSDGASSQRQLSQRVYYFDYDSNVVREEDKPAIMANASYLISHPGSQAMLEGHTDPRGSREYNVGLGERRAQAVASLMTAKGVNPSQIRVVSYGAEKLAAPGRTEADYRQDRRVVLVYLKR